MYISILVPNIEKLPIQIVSDLIFLNWNEFNEQQNFSEFLINGILILNPFQYKIAFRHFRHRRSRTDLGLQGPINKNKL